MPILVRKRSQHFFSVLLAMLLVLSLPVSAHAQRKTIMVKAGMRVQLVLKDSLWQSSLSAADQRIAGNLVRITPDSLYLQLYRSTPFGLARSDVKRVAVSNGISRPRSALIMGIGFAFLSGISYKLGSIGAHDRKTSAWTVSGIGFGVGAVLGAVSPFESWRRLRMNN